ncbi:putative MPP superfamily phosphohydrolase [Clostridiales Family XIII bacterium PM5-7]
MIKYVILIGVLIVIPFGIYFYFLLKRWVGFWKVDTTKKPVKAALIVGAIALCATLSNFFSIWAVVLLHVVMITLITDLINKLIKGKWWETAYRSGIITFLCTALIMGYGYWNISHIVEKDYQITTTKNLKQESYRVAFIADVHAGENMSGERLKEACERIQKQKPDMVILGGDIVDEQTTKAQMEEAFAVLGSLDSTYGTYYVYGNHDRQSYSADPLYTDKDLRQAITDNGIKPLEDETFNIDDSFLLVGRMDKGHGNDRAELTELIPEGTDDFIFVLDHQPTELMENDQIGSDLIVSGHTHAGQVWPIGLISELVGINEKNYGYEKMDNLNVIVTSGLNGWGYPVRTQGKSEFVIIDIKGE